MSRSRRRVFRDLARAIGEQLEADASFKRMLADLDLEVPEDVGAEMERVLERVADASERVVALLDEMAAVLR